ncbi:MAG: PAS domain S-box protein, partial [Calditrichia bacterium]|nr:PAS domain S-box protein [Calditrichia bacterium]
KGEIDSMADTAIILDKDGNVIASNFTSSYLTKYSSNDIIGLNICDIIDSKSGSFTRAGIEKVVKSGEPINFVDQQNGNTFDNYIYPIFDTHNKVQYLTVFAHDITNRKSTSKNPEIENTVSNHRIQENKAKNHKEETFKSDSVNIDIHFKQLVDNVKDAGLIVNLDGLITYWSKGAEKLYGYKPKEVLNKSFLHYFLTDDENVKKLNLTNIEKINGVYLQRGAAGKSFQGDISTSTLYDADNQPEQYFITIKDISKQVRLENEFNKFDDRLKQLVEKRTINQKKLIDKFQTEIKLYKKMEEAQRQRSLIQSMITFSAKKILDGGNWAEIIEQSLEKVGSVLKTSRVYIIENEINADGQVVMNLNYEWADEDVVHFISESTFNGITYDSIGLQRWVNQMQNGRMISGEINELPTIEQKALRKRELFSLFAIPILSNDKWIGYLGVDECLANRKWYKAEINALKTVAQIIGKGYQARKDEITLKKSSDYYHTIVENSSDWEYWVNPDGEIIYTSPACQEISGYKAEEFYNDSSLFREMIFKDDR